MAEMIEFGIDLGTTNSLIARFAGGEVTVFKNPIGFKETLPSIVAWRKDRLLVGDQARAYSERDPGSVVSRFKRRMGTTEAFSIKSLGESKTPVELSSLVLKELKGFVQTGQSVEAAVITIPSAFDTVQSNATREAGELAGFKRVVLLQEPIAASLAYANKAHGRDLRDSQWLVYDLGGGTFDVALVRIEGGEIRIVDHEGDNFLGGIDFDVRIVERLVVPVVEQETGTADLLREMKSQSGKYNTLWYKLLHKAEEARVELSSRTSAEIEFPFQTGVGHERDLSIPITRSDYESLVKPDIDTTIGMIRTILTRNSLRPKDLAFVLMVGGVTYTPFVRGRVGELLEIPVNCEVDPVAAVVVGAATFAGTREKRLGEPPIPPAKGQPVKVKVAYNRTSQDEEELFSARFDGPIDGCSYRITRADGGYDSGHKPVSARITEDLPLRKDAYNVFTLHVFDRSGNQLSHDVGPVQIAQGKYAVAGQTLPHDICLVLDDLTRDTTRLEPVFLKNTTLPARRPTTVSASRTMLSGSSDDVLRIIVVEGPAENPPHSNLTIGCLVIRGSELGKDVIRGTDIDLLIEMDESRNLRVEARITTTSQTYARVFEQTKRDVPVETLRDEIGVLRERLEEKIDEASENESYELAQRLKNLLEEETQSIEEAAQELAPDDVTDDRFKIDDRKMRLAAEMGRLTSQTDSERLRREYSETRAKCMAVVAAHGNDREQRELEEIISQEEFVLESSNPAKVQKAIENLRGLKFGVLRRTPDFLEGWFEYLAGQRERFNDPPAANRLIAEGKTALGAEDYERLGNVNMALHNLLPDAERAESQKRFTGITG